LQNIDTVEESDKKQPRQTCFAEDRPVVTWSTQSHVTMTISCMLSPRTQAKQLKYSACQELANRMKHFQVKKPSMYWDLVHILCRNTHKQKLFCY